MTTDDATPLGEDTPRTGIARRSAIKGAVGAGAAALIWAEPTIKGLVRRPAYAATASSLPAGCHFVRIEGTIDTTGTPDALPATPPTVTPQSGGPFNITYIINNNDRLRLEINDMGATFTEEPAMGVSCPITGDTALLTGSPINNVGTRIRFLNNQSGSFDITVVVCS